MLIPSTITTPRLHSYGGVSEKKLTNATKAKVATTRYHGDVHCNKNVFMLLSLNDILHGSSPNQTVRVGETIKVGCPSSGGDGNITLTCEKTGSFVPSPSTLNCTSDVSTVEGVTTPFNTKELKSCEQCDAFGTETCEKKKSGVACQCRENWSGQTCWQAADQCDITHLQCGKHGVCRSEVDYMEKTKAMRKQFGNVCSKNHNRSFYKRAMDTQTTSFTRIAQRQPCVPCRMGV
ncbi:unnamed protein product [Haemonchus placei]|uniref:Sushi domain-containing protein n=1 Tax=Haemonchus placei TaxID=6290 RepID=A0A0N4VUZ4_HAEPC|nr:unnamed protein product [Haemonchus placei]